ncbi:MAG TPA: DNA polymerase IV, partial [Actinomycetota bacterium]|nr:DNA polymerase IV [Actinomycetota bacterium]
MTHPRPAEPILHVDLDAFYASVEVLKDPSLVGRPVVVGGAGSRGVVMSASYEARAFGVRNAMPAVRARRLCPDAVFVPPDFESYRAHSNRFREILLAVTPLVEPIALDEAFLDVGGAVLLFGEPPEIARKIRREVPGGVGVRCSIGVGPSKLVAKLASKQAKPDGLVVVRREEVTVFLEPLPVRALWGVGEKTAETLGRLGIGTVGDLARTPVPTLQKAFGRHLGAHLHQLAWGTDRTELVPHAGPHEPERSMGADETFGRDTADREVIVRELLRLSARVGGRLRAAGVVGRTVTLKV